MPKRPAIVRPDFTYCSCGGVGFDVCKSPPGFSVVCGGCKETVGGAPAPKLVRLELQLPEDLSKRLDAKRGLVPRATFVRALIEGVCK